MNPNPAALALGLGLFSLAVLPVLSGCRTETHKAAYRLTDRAAYSLRYVAGLEGKAEGFGGSRHYDAQAKAHMAMKAVPDTAGGRMEVTLTADSISFQASDRDGYEGRYMVERLKRYKARLVLSATGQILALEEEPDLPPVDFSPLNFGRLLIYGMPAFPKEPLKPGSEWQVEQSLLDKFQPDSRIVKRYKVLGIRESTGGRLLECEVKLEAWLGEDLGSQEPVPEAGGPQVRGPDAGRAQPSLTGKGGMVFNLDRGVPVSSDLDLQGRFTSRVREGGGGDSANMVDLPLRLELRLKLGFGG